MGERKDFLSGNLFGRPEGGEPDYLKPGHHRNEQGEIEDDKGNVYDDDYNLKWEAPNEGLLRAREQFKGQDIPPEYVAEMGKYYQAEIERNKKIPRKEAPPQSGQEDKESET